MTNVIALTPAAAGTVSVASPAVGTPATYTVKEVATLLGLSLGGTYQAIRAGEIPAKRIRGRWIVPRHRFHAWLDAQDNDAAHLVA